ISRLDTGADVDAVRPPGPARDHRHALAERGRDHRHARNALQGRRIRDGRLHPAAASYRLSRRPIRRCARSPRRRARLAGSSPRPLTTAALTAAKLKMTIWSTLAAWMLVVVAIPLALTLSGTWPVVIKGAREVIDVFGTPRAAVLLLLVLWGFLASTWKQLVQTLYIGLTGREWAVKASVALGLALLCIVGPIAKWLHDSWGARAALWNALPWIAAALVCVKISA